MEELSDFEYTIKILILGDSCVGKTNIIYKYIENKFRDLYIGTTGIDILTTTIEIKGKKFRIQLWDTAGQERFRSITKNLFLRVQGFLLLYDITNRKTFNNLGAWIKSIREECGSHMPIIIVGNKNDLENIRSISKNEAIDFAKEEKVDYIETSSKSGENIAKVISMITEKAFENSEFINDFSFTLDTSTAFGKKRRYKCCLK